MSKSPVIASTLVDVMVIGVVVVAVASVSSLVVVSSFVVVNSRLVVSSLVSVDSIVMLVVVVSNGISSVVVCSLVIVVEVDSSNVDKVKTGLLDSAAVDSRVVKPSKDEVVSVNEDDIVE